MSASLPSIADLSQVLDKVDQLVRSCGGLGVDREQVLLTQLLSKSSVRR